MITEQMVEVARDAYVAAHNAYWRIAEEDTDVNMAHLSGLRAALEAAIALSQAEGAQEPVANCFRNVDADDWHYLLGKLGWGGRDRFWRCVFEELRPALAGALPTRPREQDGARPYGWARVHVSPSTPNGPAEYDVDFVYGDDPPEPTSWTPLYAHPLPAASFQAGAEAMQGTVREFLTRIATHNCGCTPVCHCDDNVAALQIWKESIRDEANEILRTLPLPIPASSEGR